MDRLIEFGMEMAIANQMISVMNQSMAQMKVPGATMPAAQHASMLFYFVLDGAQAGPFSEAEVTRLILDKKISPTTLVWSPGFIAWREAQQVPELMKLVALTPPPIQPPQP
ncbi:MAG: DUF4339 domain-containing protein [Bacteroidota bacterium]